MQMSSLLRPEAVRVASQMTSKKRLFQELGDLAQSVYDIDARVAVEALQEREGLGATGVGHGVALPHARIDGIAEVAGIFMRLEKPMDFGAVDRLPIDLVFTLLAPRSSGVDHLKALALVSRTLRDASVCAKLRANTEPATLHAILIEARSTQAA